MGKYIELTRQALQPIGGMHFMACCHLFCLNYLLCKKTGVFFFIFLGADLHAVALCCLLQVVTVAPEKLAVMFHEKLHWIKVCFSVTCLQISELQVQRMKFFLCK